MYIQTMDVNLSIYNIKALNIMFTIAGLLNTPALGIQQRAYNQISQTFCYFCCHCPLLRFVSV
jgi:hypothetical protein